MMLYFTLGIRGTDGEITTNEINIDLAEGTHATYLGLELERTEEEKKNWPSGGDRMTIFRQNFITD